MHIHIHSVGLLGSRWDSLSVTRKVATYAWERLLWMVDPRLSNIDRDEVASQVPVLNAHKVWLRSGRALHQPSLRSGARPSRQHLAWRCSLLESDLPLPYNECGLRLLASAVPFPPLAVEFTGASQCFVATSSSRP